METRGGRRVELAQYVLHTRRLCLLTIFVMGLQPPIVSIEIHDGPICITAPDSYPDPQVDYEACRRPLPSFICDPGGVLTQYEADKLQHMIELFHNTTHCRCHGCPPDRGALSVGVALMKNPCQVQNEASSEKIRNLTRYLRSRWKLGPCDNDILIVVEISSRQPYVDVGPGAVTVLSHEVAETIFNETRGHFESGAYYQGLESMIQSYYDSIRNVQFAGPQEERPSFKSMVVVVGLSVIALVLILIIVFMVVYVRRKTFKERAANSKADSEKGMKGWRAEGVHDQSLTNVTSATRYEPCQLDERNDSDSDEDDITRKVNGNGLLDGMHYDADRQALQACRNRRRQLSAVVEVSENEEDDPETVGLNPPDLSRESSVKGNFLTCPK